MIHNKIFDVKDSDIFDRADYPQVVQELNEVSRVLHLIPGNRKGDIMISFFKDRFIKTEYLTTNRRVVDKVLSGSLNTHFIEELFSSCRNNTAFLGEYELYIQEVLNTRMNN